jgi:hypothetical protein
VAIVCGYLLDSMSQGKALTSNWQKRGVNMNETVRYRLPIPGYYLVVPPTPAPSQVCRGWQEIGHLYLDPFGFEGRSLILSWCQDDQRILNMGVLEWPE